MKIIGVHPSALFYSKLFLRLEPLGLELVAQAARQAGHQVKLVDLQVEPYPVYIKLLKTWQPDVIAISGSYLANFPEIFDLAKDTKRLLPDCFVVVGGHSASFIPEEILDHAAGAVDCVLIGEGEASITELLEAIEHDKDRIDLVPGSVSRIGEGPPPFHLGSLEDIFPARDLLRKRGRYFIGILDPCASIEFSRGCPWDCSFCSAWTFYGRKYRLVSPEKAVDDLERIREEGIFIVDDVAFLHQDHGMKIGEEILRRGLKKRFYLETRADILIKNRDVFKFWTNLGLEYMFVGLEAIDEQDLDRFRKRMSLSKNFEALEIARSLGIEVAVNLIVDPGWDQEKFEVVREWALEAPEIVNLSIFTPYPGTESWLMEPRRLTTRDYRLFDIQHAVLPTRLPLEKFYEEVVKTQQIVNMKFLGLKRIKELSSIIFNQVIHGQTNFLKLLFGFNKLYHPGMQLADHQQEVKYKLNEPIAQGHIQKRNELYVLGGN